MCCKVDTALQSQTWSQTAHSSTTQQDSFFQEVWFRWAWCNVTGLLSTAYLQILICHSEIMKWECCCSRAQVAVSVSHIFPMSMWVLSKVLQYSFTFQKHAGGLVDLNCPKEWMCVYVVLRCTGVSYLVQSVPGYCILQILSSQTRIKWLVKMNDFSWSNSTISKSFN